MGSDNMGPSSHPPERISNVVKSYDNLFVSELSGSLHPSSCLFLVETTDLVFPLVIIFVS